MTPPHGLGQNGVLPEGVPALEIDAETIAEVEGNLATTAGTCAVMGTASTMACITDFPSRNTSLCKLIGPGAMGATKDREKLRKVLPAATVFSR